jgi:hypothetical protein
MRPNHQNRRPRNNNGRPQRKSSNPLSRTFESNGPDVKVRGNAQHVAEKYTQLARDAQAAGDPVLAESYLQHSEHYCRLIIVAQSHLHAISMGKTQEEAAQDNDDYDDLDSEPDRFTFVVPNVGGRNPPQASDETLAGYGPQPHERGGEGSSAGGGEYPRERQPARHSERNPAERTPDRNQERNAERPRYSQNPDQASGGHRNAVRRDQYGRRERYQGAPEGENTLDPQGATVPSSETNGYSPSPEANNGEYQPREGRRDRFGRNRFGRPHRGSRFESGEGQEAENSHNPSSLPRFSDEGRAQEAPRETTHRDTQREHRQPRHEQRHERASAPSTEGDIGLPAFLTQAPRVVHVEPAVSAPVAHTPIPRTPVLESDEPLVKRGRGRPRKVVPEEGFDL